MLSKIRILDFTTTLPGPFATMMLGDLGATVVRILPPGYTEPISLDEGGDQIIEYLNRNKTILRIDLKTEEGKKTVQDLIPGADVIIEGFRPGTMSRLGFGYEEVNKTNPSIIYCSISGYGYNGKKAADAGHDINYLGISGIASLIKEQGKIVVPGLQLGDVAGGSHFAVISILSAIIHRQTTGKGQFIDVPITDCTMTLAPLHAPVAINGFNVKSEMHPLSGGSYYGDFETADGKYLSIGSLEPKFYKGLCEVLGIEYKATMQFSSKLRDLVASKIITNTLDHWTSIFSDRDLCVEPCIDYQHAVTGSYANDKNMLITLDDNPSSKQLAYPVKYSDFKPKYMSMREVDCFSWDA